MVLQPAREGNIRDETFDFAMMKRKSRDVFPSLGFREGNMIKIGLKERTG